MQGEWVARSVQEVRQCRNARLKRVNRATRFLVLPRDAVNENTPSTALNVSQKIKAGLPKRMKIFIDRV